MDISRIDKNFAAERVSYDGMTVYRLPHEPFEIHGLYKFEPGCVKRLPDEVAAECNEPLRQMNVCPSGGRIRFRTDSTRIVIKCSIRDMLPYPHMAFTGSHCFDLYADGEFTGVFRPDTSAKGEPVSRRVFYYSQGYDSMLSFPEKTMRDIMIHFPLYACVDEVCIALDEDAELTAPRLYTLERPFVFYGTSVTQGGCVSHPGNNYPALLSRWLDADFINLGFSDGGRGEQAMARYISSLGMSALVLNYDGNAREPERLREVYEPFYKTVREARPDLPVIFASNMFDYRDDLTARGASIIEDVYRRARDAGDSNLYFINGAEAIAPFGGTAECSVERCHANDLGSWAMARAIEPVLRGVLFKDNNS